MRIPHYTRNGYEGRHWVFSLWDGTKVYCHAFTEAWSVYRRFWRDHRNQPITFNQDMKGFDFEYEFSHFIDMKDEELGTNTWSEEDLRQLAEHFFMIGKVVGKSE